MKLVFLILLLTSLVFAGRFSSGPVNIYDANPNNDAGEVDWETIVSNPSYQPNFGSITQAPSILSFDGDCTVSSCARTDSVFTGGGSKDILDIPSWQWKEAKPQPKAEILNSAALLWSNPTDNHVHLYWAADRYDNSGSTFLGLWLLGDEVSPIGTGKGASPFTGVHTTNDLLTVVNFGGNGDVEITVYRWDPTCEDKRDGCADTTLFRVFGTSDGRCDPSNDDQVACATENMGDQVTAVWPFCSKGVGCADSGQAYKTAEYIEGAVDISIALGLAEGGAPCFGSFLVETRASESTDSTLSDFTTGPFGGCSAEYQTVCDGTGEPIARGIWKYCFETTVTNTGAGRLNSIKVQLNPMNGNVVSNTALDKDPLLAGEEFTVTWCAEAPGARFNIDENTVIVTAEDSNGNDFPVAFTNPGTCIGEQRTISATGYVTDCEAFLTTQTNNNGATVVVVGFNYDIVINPIGSELDQVYVSLFSPAPPGSLMGAAQWTVSAGDLLANNQIYTNNYVYYPDVTQADPAQAEWTLGPFNAVVSNELWGDVALLITGQDGQTVTCKLCPE